MSVRGASEQVVQTVSSWEGVESYPHRFGGTEFRLGKREIGHIHGDHLVDIPFPTKVRDEIIASGDAQPHHILPDSGWISFYLRQPEDIPKAIALLEKSYLLALEQQRKRSAQSENKADLD